MSPQEAAAEVLSCCGSHAWAEAMAAARPYDSPAALLRKAAEIWNHLAPEDWQEAFESHPRIGERHASRPVSAVSSNWSQNEQSAVEKSDADVRTAIAEGNRRYEERFGRIFIIRAAGREPGEILHALERRLRNDPETERKEAAAEQAEITGLRLRRWLGTEETP